MSIRLGKIREVPPYIEAVTLLPCLMANIDGATCLDNDAESLCNNCAAQAIYWEAAFMPNDAN